MATVVKKGPGDTEDRLIAKFRRKVQAEGLLSELKELEFYKKPSLIKKEQKKLRKQARRRRR